MATPTKTLAAVAAGTVLTTDALAQGAKIDGKGFHYVTAGTGDPVLLIPGGPRAGIACRKIGRGFAQFTDGKPDESRCLDRCASLSE